MSWLASQKTGLCFRMLHLLMKSGTLGAALGTCFRCAMAMAVQGQLNILRNTCRVSLVQSSLGVLLHSGIPLVSEVQYLILVAYLVMTSLSLSN